MVAGSARIRVTFQVDADGLLSVSAREKSSGVEASVVVKPSYGLTDDEIVSIVRVSQERAQDDMAARSLREQQVEAGRILEAIEAALLEDGDQLLASAERMQIDTAMANLQRILEGNSHQAIKMAVEELNRLTELLPLDVWTGAYRKPCRSQT